MTQHGDGWWQDFDNEYKIKNYLLNKLINKLINKMKGWMHHHGDGWRQVLYNSEYKIKDANKMDGWMARHGDGCRQGWDEDACNTDMIVRQNNQT